MSTAIYIVIFARNAWWVDLDGVSTGPYTDIEFAMTEAVTLASATSRKGLRSEVRVARPGHDNELIYQSTSRSLLGRAVAMHH